MRSGKRGSKTGVLHTNFYGNSSSLLAIYPKNTPYKISKRETKGIMKNDNNCHYQTARQYVLGIMTHNNSDDKRNGNG